MKDERAIFLVEEQANPSTDYFVFPAASTNKHRVIRCGFADLPAPSDMDRAVVVFVRYVPPAWAKLVDAVRPRLHKLVFFMDDDVLDMTASGGMPWRYRLKLARLAAWRRSWLQRQGAEFWVSTPYLQIKYAELHPKLVLPSYLEGSKAVRQMFYHGSSSHNAEIGWLRPIIEEALRRDERLAMEIVGGQDVYRLYRDLPRVTVVHPMKWPTYQAFLATRRRHIGLAPLLDSPFNRGRSYTKFFDITRCGAVGVYSSGSTYSEVVGHERNGLVVELRQEVWVEAILRLAQDEPLRQCLLHNAEQQAAKLSDKAQHEYAVLLK